MLESIKKLFDVDYKDLLMNNWSFMRGVRIAGGIYLLIDGVVTHQYLFVGLGGFVLLQGVMNWGCGGNCSSGSCTTKK